jgi:hypothetical protein
MELLKLKGLVYFLFFWIVEWKMSILQFLLVVWILGRECFVYTV